MKGILLDPYIYLGPPSLMLKDKLAKFYVYLLEHIH